jgi:hypothetical protein
MTSFDYSLFFDNETNISLRKGKHRQVYVVARTEVPACCKKVMKAKKKHSYNSPLAS